MQGWGRVRAKSKVGAKLWGKVRVKSKVRAMNRLEIKVKSIPFFSS